MLETTQGAGKPTSSDGRHPTKEYGTIHILDAADQMNGVIESNNHKHYPNKFLCILWEYRGKILGLYHLQAQ